MRKKRGREGDIVKKRIGGREGGIEREREGMLLLGVSVCICLLSINIPVFNQILCCVHTLISVSIAHLAPVACAVLVVGG